MDYTIPEDWLTFCEVASWSRQTDYYVYPQGRTVEILALADIEPPQRDDGMAPFKKFKMVPVLMAFLSPECSLPPVVVEPLAEGSSYRYKLANGFHRFYASLHVGYTHIPADIREPFEP